MQQKGFSRESNRSTHQTFTTKTHADIKHTSKCQTWKQLNLITIPSKYLCSAEEMSKAWTSGRMTGIENELQSIWYGWYMGCVFAFFSLCQNIRCVCVCVVFFFSFKDCNGDWLLSHSLSRSLVWWVCRAHTQPLTRSNIKPFARSPALSAWARLWQI